MNMNEHMRDAMQAALDASLNEEIEKIRSLLTIIGVDLVFAPDGSSATITPKKGGNIILDAMLGPEVAPSFNMTITMELAKDVAKENKAVILSTKVIAIDIAKGYLKSLSGAMEATRKVDAIIKDIGENGARPS